MSRYNFYRFVRDGEKIGHGGCLGMSRQGDFLFDIAVFDTEDIRAACGLCEVWHTASEAGGAIDPPEMVGRMLVVPDVPWSVKEGRIWMEHARFSSVFIDEKETVVKVRAKFVCKSKEEVLQGIDGDGTPKTGFRVRLEAVYGTSPENKEFFQYTPSADIDLSTVNPKAAEQFEVGASYYVDFEKAPE